MITKERIEAARKVKTELYAMEDAIDDAIICAADLMKSCAEGRQKAGLSAIAGSDVFDELSKATQSLHRARKQVVNAHQNLTDLAGDVGIPAIASGGGTKPPMFQRSASALRVVDDAEKVA